MLKRRQPRDVNEIASVEVLLTEWTSLSTRKSKQFKISSSGNINLNGEINGKHAVVYAPVDLHFESSIENGVKPLVFALVNEPRLVTYTSCEGHNYWMEEHYSECHVGVLPRTCVELRKIWRALKICIAQCAHNMRVSKPRIYPCQLFDQSKNRQVAVIDIYLHKHEHATEADYFSLLSEDVMLFASVLSEVLSNRKCFA